MKKKNTLLERDRRLDPIYRPIHRELKSLDIAPLRMIAPTDVTDIVCILFCVG